MSTPVNFTTVAVTKTKIKVRFVAAPGDKPWGYLLRYEAKTGRRRFSVPGDFSAAGYQRMKHRGNYNDTQYYEYTNLRTYGSLVHVGIQYRRI